MSRWLSTLRQLAPIVKDALDDGPTPTPASPWYAEGRADPSWDLLDVVDPAAAGKWLVAKGAAGAVKAAPAFLVARGLRQERKKLAESAAYRKAADLWLSGSDWSARQQLADMPVPEVLKQEKLRRLTKMTDVRRNPETGAIEFRLFRGDNPDALLTQRKATSWTTNPRVADHNFGHNRGAVFEAWVPADKIKMYPNAVAQNSFTDEAEVIVDQLDPSHIVNRHGYTNPNTPMSTLDQALDNEREADLHKSITARGSENMTSWNRQNEIRWRGRAAGAAPLPSKEQAEFKRWLHDAHNKALAAPWQPKQPGWVPQTQWTNEPLTTNKLLSGLGYGPETLAKTTPEAEQALATFLAPPEKPPFTPPLNRFSAKKAEELYKLWVDSKLQLVDDPSRLGQHYWLTPEGEKVYQQINSLQPPYNGRDVWLPHDPKPKTKVTLDPSDPWYQKLFGDDVPQ